MENFNLQRITLCTLTLVLCQTSLFSQESKIARLETEFLNLESALNVLSERRAELTQSIQNNSAEIQRLKNNHDLGYFQRQKLEDLLRASQLLAQQIASVDKKSKEIEKSHRDTGQNLIGEYDSEIKKILETLESKRIDSETRKTQLARVENLKRNSEEIKGKIATEAQTELKILKVEIEPDDSLRQIKLKADLLKDQEEKFRKFSKQTAEQVEELQQELQLRTRINDLVTDITVFDQQDEGVTGFFNDNANANLAQGEEDVAIGAEVRPEAFDSNVPVGQKDFDWANLSVDQIEEVIEQLQRREKRTQATADSLAKRARIFYKAAQNPQKK